MLPSEPLTFGTEWLTIGADVSATASCASVAGNTSHCTTDTGFFNYTDYQHSALRMLIVGVTTEVKAGDRLSLLAEIRSENGGLPDPYALYVRVRPWRTHGFDIQAGRVPPDLRRLRPAPLSVRQPADRLPAGVSVPHLASSRRAAGERRRTAADARTRLALELLGRQPGAGQRAAARPRVSLGYRRPGARGESARGSDRRRDDRHARQPARRRRQQPAVRLPDVSCCGRSPGLAGRRLRRARTVRDDRRAAHGRHRTPTRARSHRRPGAPTPSIRAATTWCGSRRS